MKNEAPRSKLRGIAREGGKGAAASCGELPDPRGIKFQADADLNEDIVTGIVRREPGVDFRTASAAGLHGLKDPDVLAIAADDGRILITHDRKTMPKHFAAFIQTATSPGLIIVSQKSDLLPVIEELILIWFASEADEWVNSISTVPL